MEYYEWESCSHAIRMIAEPFVDVHVQVLTLVQWFYVGEKVYDFTMFFVKTAILLQYLSVFAPQKCMNSLMWWSARIIIIVTAVFYVLLLLIAIFACSPREAIWNPLITGAQCVDKSMLTLIDRLFNIISDIIILALPARAVWQLRIPLQRKIRITLLFGIGLL